MLAAMVWSQELSKGVCWHRFLPGCSLQSYFTKTHHSADVQIEQDLEWRKAVLLQLCTVSLLT